MLPVRCADFLHVLIENCFNVNDDRQLVKGDTQRQLVCVCKKDSHKPQKIW